MVKFKKFLYRTCPILACFILVIAFISPCFVSAGSVINYLDYVTSVVEYSDYNLITCEFPVTMSYIYAAWRYLEDVDYQPVDDIEFTSRTGSLSTTFNFGDIPIQEHQTFWLNIVPFADCLDIRSFASNIQLSYSFSLFFDTDVDLDYSSGNVLSGSNTLYTFDQTAVPEVYGDLAIDIYNEPANYTRLGQVQEFNASFSLDEATVSTYPYIACQTELRGFNVDTIANSWYIDVTINSCRLYFQVAKDNPINDDITQALDRNNQKLDEMVNGTPDQIQDADNAVDDLKQSNQKLEDLSQSMDIDKPSVNFQDITNSAINTPAFTHLSSFISMFWEDETLIGIVTVLAGFIIIALVLYGAQR